MAGYVQAFHDLTFLFKMLYTNYFRCLQRTECQTVFRFSLQSEDESARTSETGHLQAQSPGLANTLPRGFRLARPLSIDESRLAGRRASVGAGALGAQSLATGSTGYHSSATNALTLGETTNLQRIRQLLGQSAPSLTASLVNNFQFYEIKKLCILIVDLNLRLAHNIALT